MAVSPFLVDQSTQARGYTALIFFSILSCYYFLKIIGECKKDKPIKYIIVSVLGIYTHLYMSMVILSQIIIILLGVFVIREKEKPLLSLMFIRETKFRK